MKLPQFWPNCCLGLWEEPLGSHEMFNRIRVDNDDDDDNYNNNDDDDNNKYIYNEEEDRIYDASCQGFKALTYTLHILL